MKKIFITHAVGNRNVRAVISAFKNNGMLARFCTTLAVNTKNPLLNLLPLKLRKELVRRSYELNNDQIYTRPYLELSRYVLPKIGFKSAVKHEVGFASTDKVFGDMDRAAGAYLPNLNKSNKVDAVYAYEDGALDTFISAKKMGICCLYDLPIGYWRAARILLETEQKRWPEWSATLTGFNDSQVKLNRKDDELAMADMIFVASTFTAKTLINYPGQLPPLVIIPYGFPPVTTSRKYDDIVGRPLKLLFVGGLSQRKGIADLFSAVSNIGHSVELTVIGQKSNADCTALDNALKLHKWIPSLPHDEVLEMMRQHDVLVFPSLFEGFGLVITEAMSQGTPVITTDRTAGPDLITHNKNGWIVEAGSTIALQSQIEKLLENPESIIAAGRAAMEKAKERPWEKYGQELSDAINQFLQ
jgi:glycosyltransferase involved in cell wall biosynthesis